MTTPVNPKTNSDLIWHYTSVNTLWEFLKPDAKLYATHWAFLNDREELLEHNKKPYPFHPADGFSEQVKEKLARWTERKIYPFIFLTCFSQKSDDLSQWRAYAPNGGFSIGLSRKKLYEAFDTSAESSPLGIYAISFSDDKRSDGKFMVCSGACNYKKQARSNIASISGGFKVVRDELPVQNHFEELFFKNASFKDESELRLVISSDERFVQKHLEVIGGKPRVAIPFKDGIQLSDLVEEICVSPHGNVESNRDLVNLLTAFRNDSISLRQSTIPYRS